MLLFISISMLSSTNILCFALDKRETTEPEEVISQGNLRYFRDVKKEEVDDSLVGTFTIEPLSHVGEGVTRPYVPSNQEPKSAYDDAFSDPLWKKQWYMHDYRTVLGPVMDLNVVPVYRMGITGAGIYVAVVDSGVEMDHPDLQSNLVKELSFTVGSFGGDKKGTAEPKNHLFKGKINHGTNAAGVIGMTANNSICGAGMAYDAKIIAINGDVFFERSYLVAKSLSHARDVVDIYSNSWGPEDSGMDMEHMKKLTAAAIDDGTKHGRKGLGSIFIFAGGNGAHTVGDNCSADEYVNYIHTIGIGAATQDGKRAEYSEACAAIYAVAYVQGRKSYVTTTTLGGKCMSFYKGTSAAAPMASAIIALVLQANNRLTYRDVMHLITMGSEVAPLADNESWNKNAAGFWVSNEFGFGLINAYNMVKLAMQWTNVPEKTLCEFKFKLEKDILFFRLNFPTRVKQYSDGCQNSEKLEERVFYLEQVILTTCVKHRYRGALSINLKSPKGTETEILTPRKNDKHHKKGLVNWNLKSVHHWGEDPIGEWQIEVKANFLRTGLGKAWENMYQTLQPFVFRMPDYYETGQLHSFTLWFHGTRDAPDHHKKELVPRTYSAFRTADGRTSDPLTHLQKTEGGLSSQRLHEAQI